VAAYFFDSSSLVKRYVNETGTIWVQTLCDPAAKNKLFIARITAVEVISAATRQNRASKITTAELANISSQLRVDLANDYRIVEISATLLDRSMTLAETHALRAYDAVQLAAVEETQTTRAAKSLSAVTLVSSDIALNAAATALGIPVEDPNLHP